MYSIASFNRGSKIILQCNIFDQVVRAQYCIAITLENQKEC